MTYKEYKNEAYNLYTIKTDKFKTCHMEIVFYNKFDKNKITELNMLTDLLFFTSKKYNKRKLVVEKLEDLYSASFYGVSSRIGNVRSINFVYNFIDPLYTDKNYLREVIKFPFEMIFKPNIINDEFDLNSYKIIKNRTLADIESVKESPIRYSLKRSLKVMDDTHPAGLDMVGYLSDLNRISADTLVKTYNDFMRDFKCDIYIVGNLNMEKVAMMINENFRNNIIKNNKFDAFVNISETGKVRKVMEYDDFEQATLSMIYNTNKFSEYERNYVMPVFNSIFGNGSLNSKLYQNLREKNSLCYNLSSMYQKYDQLLIVYAGIDAKNRDKAVKLVKKSLKDMELGNFSLEDVKNGIQIIKNSIGISMDSPSSLTDNYLFHNLANIDLINDIYLKIGDVTKEQIMSLAKKIKLNTVYIMAPGGKNEGN